MYVCMYVCMYVYLKGWGSIRVYVCMYVCINNTNCIEVTTSLQWLQEYVMYICGVFEWTVCMCRVLSPVLEVPYMPLFVLSCYWSGPGGWLPSKSMQACMYVCMYVCMQVCMNVCILEWVRIHQGMYVCMCECMQVYMHMYVCVCMCVCVWVCVCIYMYVCMQVYMHMYVCVCMRVCMCEYVCVYYVCRWLNVWEGVNFEYSFRSIISTYSTSMFERVSINQGWRTC